MNDFLRRLEADVSPLINRILNHPLILAINDARLTRQQLLAFTEVYGSYCEVFPCCLAATASRIPDDATRLPVVANLWEEHGSGDIARSHRTLYDRFRSAVRGELDSLPNSSLDRVATKYIGAIYTLCNNENFLVGLGALGPGTEYFTNPEYSLILKGLRKYAFLSMDALEFWSAHIDIDDHHYSDLLSSLTPWTVDSVAQEAVMHGAREAISLEIEFWDGLRDHIL